MGTRSVTNFFDGGTHLVTIYRQSDGYLSGHGKSIVEAFRWRQFVNGMRGSAYDKYINGMGCAAALLIAWLKRDMKAGNVYISPPSPEHTEEFEYAISGDTMCPEAGMSIKVTSYGETLYDGPMSGFDPEAIEREHIA